MQELDLAQTPLRQDLLREDVGDLRVVRDGQMNNSTNQSAASNAQEQSTGRPHLLDRTPFVGR
jgi:hypothetical protein